MYVWFGNCEKPANCFHIGVDLSKNMLIPYSISTKFYSANGPLQWNADTAKVAVTGGEDT